MRARFETADTHSVTNKLYEGKHHKNLVHRCIYSAGGFSGFWEGRVWCGILVCWVFCGCCFQSKWNTLKMKPPESLLRNTKRSTPPLGSWFILVFPLTFCRFRSPGQRKCIQGLLAQAFCEGYNSPTLTLLLTQLHGTGGFSWLLMEKLLQCLAHVFHSTSYHLVCELTSWQPGWFRAVIKIYFC